jgi:lysophospholipase L1-like esterase
MIRMLPVVFAVTALAACGSKADPFAGTPDSAGSGSGVIDAAPGSADAKPTPDAGPSACAPKPKRVAVLGDSIASCYNVGNANGADCAYKQFHTYLGSHYADGVAYLNVAVAGAVTQDLTTQMKNVPGAPGHLLVVVQVGGNNLAPYIFQSDQQAQAGYDTELPKVKTAWAAAFAYFEDKSKFPDGVTVMVSNQYDPFDDCTAQPYTLSPLKISLLHKFNDELAAIAAAHPGGVYVDQFTTFLGHGHHNTVAACPHYIPNAANWMQDLIHPNAAGHAHLATVLNGAADQIYGAACQ